MQRINRALAKDDEQMHRTRGARALMDLGEFYIRDTRRSIILYQNVDPEGTARELGVLADHEHVVED